MTFDLDIWHAYSTLSGSCSKVKTVGQSSREEKILLKQSVRRTARSFLVDRAAVKLVHPR